MAYNRRGMDDIISDWLEENSDDESVGEASEVEDHVSEDDTQEDEEEGFIEDARIAGDLSDRREEESVPSVSPENSETLESSSADRRILVPARRILKGKNQHCWSTSKGESRGRTTARNIVHTSRGPTRMCRNVYEPSLCFELFMTVDIIDEVVKWTNVEISAKRPTGNTHATCKDTCLIEIKAYFGILALTAAMKDNHLTTTELFDSTFSGSRYIAVMSKERFNFLTRCLRMDDKTLRPSLRQEDPFIPVRKIWELFIQQCKSNYTPGNYVTIDEQLVGFRGRCPFRMYIPNKPTKYGIKIPMMCDNGSKYMVNALPYIGRATDTQGLPQGEYYVKELSRPIHGTNRNVTCDNWFTSVPLAKSLLAEPYKLTLVGTIRSNKREIPEEMKNTRQRPVGTSMFAYDGSLTLVSYKPKPAKMVYLLSSCDEQGIINTETGKPEMNLFYNQTKGGVDTFDQMTSNMSCSRKTNRWPMAMLYAILNMSFVNSYVIYCHNMSTKNEKPMSRRQYMKKLSTQLSSPWMEKRLEAPTLKRKLRETIEDIIKKPTGSSAIPEGPPPAKKRRYCSYCESKKKRMSKMTCAKCEKPICGEHQVHVCTECV